MRHRGVLHIIRMLPTHYQVVFARHRADADDEALAACTIKGPTELSAFLERAGVRAEAVKEVLKAIMEKSSHSVEGLSFSDEDIDRLFPQVTPS